MDRTPGFHVSFSAHKWRITITRNVFFPALPWKRELLHFS